MLLIIWLMAMDDKWRPDGVLWGCWTIVILSVSIKDRTVVVPQVMLNACLMFSWPDKSFRPRSLTLSGPVLDPFAPYWRWMGDYGGAKSKSEASVAG